MSEYVEIEKMSMDAKAIAIVCVGLIFGNIIATAILYPDGVGFFFLVQLIPLIFILLLAVIELPKEVKRYPVKREEEE